jgi:hypothetical protein
MWDDDEDFVAMGPDAKYVYNFLLGQGDLGHSGVIVIRVAPWARRLSKSVAEVEAALDELHAEKFVVLDRDEMLLLVRSLIRRDGVYKQPNVFKSAAAQIRSVPSKPIRRALIGELERLEESNMNGDSQRLCAELVAWLRKTSGNPSPNPSSKSQSGESPDDAQDGHEPGNAAGDEGFANPSAKGVPRAPASARVPQPLPPPLAPSPNPGVPAAAPNPAAPARDSAAAPPEPDREFASAGPEKNAGTLVAEWVEHRTKNGGRPPGEIIGRAGKKLKQLLEDDGIPYDTVRQGFIEWDLKGRDPSAIASFVNQVQSTWSQPAPRADPRPSATARAVQSGMDLVARMAAREGVNLDNLIPFPERRELTA